MAIATRRVYEQAGRNDGTRVLVDRVWPRGVTRAQAAVDHWFKELAPSTALRKWFGHDAAKWSEFKKRYFKELDGQPEAMARLFELAGTGKVTLVYGARDQRHNNAVALKEYLDKRLKQHPAPRG